MFQKLTLPLLLFVFHFGIIHAQEKLDKFALTIVDTSESDYVQAKQIYDWVTANIIYDIKSFKRFELPNYSPQEILSKQRGVCYEYSLIYSELCNTVGIESYVVSGYSKGFRYYKGMPFLRAEHSWVVFYADSSWKFADPTWGAGHLYLKSRLHRKLLNKLTGINSPKNKLTYKAEKNDFWFDIPADSLVLTHYPLEPAWFNTSLPYSFVSFEKDSVLQKEPYSEYANNLQQLQGKEREHIMKQEGITGNQFNPHNYFDLANGYVALSSPYDIDREIRASNLGLFEKYSRDYGIILEAIQRHIEINDSVYRVRKTELKKLESSQNRIARKVDSKARSAKSSFRSGNKSIVGRSGSFRKKQESYLLRAERAKLRIIPDGAENDTVKIDFKKVNEMYAELLSLRASNDSLVSKSDSLFLVIDQRIERDAQLDDSIEYGNNVFAGVIHDLIVYLDQIDEDKIKANVDNLVSEYYAIADLLAKKKSSKRIMRKKSTDFYSNVNLLQSSLKQQSGILKKLYKETNFSDSIKQEHNKVLMDLITSYEQSRVYTGKLDRHNMLQADENKINLKALKYQRKAIKRESRRFNAWYKDTYEYHEAKYMHEKMIAKSIRANAQKSKRIVDSKLKKYNLMLEKKLDKTN